MTTITISRKQNNSHSVPFWFKGVQYWANRQMYYSEYNLIREALQAGILPFAE